MKSIAFMLSLLNHIKVERHALCVLNVYHYDKSSFDTTSTFRNSVS